MIHGLLDRPLLQVVAIFLGLTLGFFPDGVLAAQSETQQSGSSSQETRSERSSSAIPRISLGSQTGTPGINVVIPLYLVPPEGVELGLVAVEIEWVSQNLKFARSERGIVAEMIGADVEAKVTGTRNETGQSGRSIEYSTLRVDASVVGQDPRRGFQEGLLAYLTFSISSEAQPFAIELRPRLVSATALSPAGRTFAQAETENGKVTVELPGLPPYVTCFFFTH